MSKFELNISQNGIAYQKGYEAGYEAGYADAVRKYNKDLKSLLPAYPTTPDNIGKNWDGSPL